jgi:hypothetical protein
LASLGLGFPLGFEALPLKNIPDRLFARLIIYTQTTKNACDYIPKLNSLFKP